MKNFFMEDFEKKAVEQRIHKTVCWFRYVDDTFVIWPHGQDKLTEFLNHLSGLHNKIQFTMEIGEEGHVPFRKYKIQTPGNYPEESIQHSE
jgi:hypothetical protein